MKELNSGELNFKKRLAVLPFEILWGEVVGETNVEVEGLERNALIFESEHIQGAKLFTGDLLLNRRLLDSDMEEARKNVFLHEEAHRRQGPLAFLGGIAQMILTPPGLLAGLLISILMIMAKIGIINAPGIIGSPDRFLTYILTIYASSAAVSYIMELDAQFFVMDRRERDAIEEGRQQSREEWKKGPLKSMVLYTSHPPEKLVNTLYRLLRG